MFYLITAGALLVAILCAIGLTLHMHKGVSDNE